MHKLFWNAILKAKGFEPNFVEWWRQRPVVDPGATHRVPWDLPSTVQVDGITANMKALVDGLERLVMQQRIAKSKARHERDTNAVFKDVKKDGAQPVDTLLQITKAKVVEIPEAASVIFDADVTFAEGIPVQGDNAPLFVEVCSDNQVWFTCEHNLHPFMVA